MVQINMLPWREQARQIKKKDFFIQMAIAIGITLFIIFLFHMYYDDLIRYQERRNTYLETAIGEKQLEMNELRKKKEEQDTIQAKLYFLMALREKSYRAVRLLNELLRIVPDTITLSKVTRTGNNIALEGKAQSDLAITAFLKSISQSPLFNQPVLTGISTAASGAKIGEKFFQVKMEQKDQPQKEQVQKTVK